jgi:hypothetical protein
MSFSFKTEDKTWTSKAVSLDLFHTAKVKIVDSGGESGCAVFTTCHCSLCTVYCCKYDLSSLQAKVIMLLDTDQSRVINCA